MLQLRVLVVDGGFNGTQVAPWGFWAMHERRALVDTWNWGSGDNQAADTLRRLWWRCAQAGERFVRGWHQGEARCRADAGGGGAHGREKDLYVDGIGARRGVVRMRAVAAERTRPIRARRASVQSKSTAGASRTRAHCWRQHDIGANLEHFLNLNFDTLRCKVQCPWRDGGPFCFLI